MALVRCVTEMGMGVDVHGLDYTAAAKRAVFDAIHHSSLNSVSELGVKLGVRLYLFDIAADEKRFAFHSCPR